MGKLVQAGRWKVIEGKEGPEVEVDGLERKIGPDGEVEGYREERRSRRRGRKL
jgi:hypothetical protein